MSESNDDTRVWHYSDVNGAQKGPVPTVVLSRLLEKGVGVTAQTLVWKAGMDNWLPVSNVEPFQSIVKFNAMQWYYIDIEGNQHGPIFSKLLVHKLKEGDIDGLSLVYGGDLTEWKKISDVQVLKDELAKIAIEEENMRQAFLKAEENNKEEMQKQVFMDDIDPRKAYEMAFSDAMKTHETPVSSKDKNSLVEEMGDIKTYIADNGVKYIWDEEEQDWVEDDNDDDASMEDTNTNTTSTTTAGTTTTKDDQKSNKKRKASNNENNDTVESDDEGEEGDSGNTIRDTGNTSGDTGNNKPKKKRNKKKTKKGPNTWVYITGLPPDITAEEIKDHFSKVGLIALSPYDQQPKIKIYREDPTTAAATTTVAPVLPPCKGDCLLCYNSEDSVKLAIDILHDGYIRPNYQVSVTRAEFTPNPTSGGSGGSTTAAAAVPRNMHRPSLSQAQVKVARTAMKQALTWNEDDDIGVSKTAALRIVVLEGLFKPDDFKDPSFSDEIESDLASECEKYGIIEKITLFSSNPRGIVIIKFSTSYAAQECIRVMNGRYFNQKKIKSFYWDGSTNYTINSNSGSGSNNHDDEEEKKELERLNEFGDWLEKDQENLPEEFQLRTE